MKKNPRLIRRGDIVKIKLHENDPHTEHVVGQVQMALLIEGGVTVLLDPDTDVEIVPN